MRNFDYIRVESVNQAVITHSAHRDAVYLGGGTTLLDLMKLDIVRPACVIDIHKLSLTQIERLPDGRTRIGAMVTNTTLARDPYVDATYPVLSQALLAGASTQLRNKATTAGNIMQRVRCGYFRDGISPCNKRSPGSGCSAILGHNRNVHAVLGTTLHCIAAHPSDMCVAIAAIGGTVQVEGRNGSRSIDFEQFHLLPGSTPWKEHALEAHEMVTHVTLNAPMQHSRSAYLKLRDRASYQFALASSAVILAIDGGLIKDARIAIGGVATKPWRAIEAEVALRGQRPGDEIFRHSAALALEGAQSYSQNGFKITLGQQVIVRNLTTLCARI